MNSDPTANDTNPWASRKRIGALVAMTLLGLIGVAVYHSTTSRQSANETDPKLYSKRNTLLPGPCQPTSCSNEALCRQEVDNNENFHECICTGGWEGDTCSDPVDECANNDCAAGSTCEIVYEINKTFKCTCPADKVGVKCDLDCPDDCSDCRASFDGSTAICYECTNSKVLHFGECRDSCPSGYELQGTGPTGLTCADKNECAEDPPVCQNGGLCQNFAPFVVLKGYTCDCSQVAFHGEHCEIDSLCTPNNPPCGDSHNTCVNTGTDYECQCHPAFTGENCDVDVDECLSDPCQNGGSCVNEPGTVDINGFRCECPDGFDGPTCEIQVNCNDEPCRHNGVCTSLAGGGFKCDCVGGYAGKICTDDLDECASNPCQNGGSCSTPEFNSFSCTCAEGWTGDECTLDINECSSDPCVAPAFCENTDGGFQCLCPAAKHGPLCQYDDVCATSSPCANGGTCIPDQDSFTCECTEGWTGTNCTESSDPGNTSGSGVPVGPVAGAAGGAVGLIILAIIVYFVFFAAGSTTAASMARQGSRKAPRRVHSFSNPGFDPTGFETNDGYMDLPVLDEGPAALSNPSYAATAPGGVAAMGSGPSSVSNPAYGISGAVAGGAATTAAASEASAVPSSLTNPVYDDSPLPEGGQYLDVENSGSANAADTAPPPAEANDQYLDTDLGPDEAAGAATLPGTVAATEAEDAAEPGYLQLDSDAEDDGADNSPSQQEDATRQEEEPLGFGEENYLDVEDP